MSDVYNNNIIIIFTLPDKNAPLESGEDDDEELERRVEEDARGVRLKHATAKWIVSHSENTLTDLSLTIKPGK